jgi:alpha-tubulin suppressor-like RCC1 family protein
MFRYPLRGAISSLSVGEDHLCYIQAGVVFCAGSAEFGATSFEKDSFNAFRQLAGIDPRSFQAKIVSAGAVHTCAILTDLKLKKDTAFCWGDNSVSQSGRLSTGDLRFSHVPQRLTALDTSVKKEIDLLVSGYAHSCVVFNRMLNCWGSNLKNEIHSFKKFAEMPHYIRRVPVSNVSAVALGVHSTCFLHEGRKLKCAGFLSH